MTDIKHTYRRSHELYYIIDNLLRNEDFIGIDNTLSEIDYQNDEDLVYCIGSIRFTFPLRDELPNWHNHVNTLREREDVEDSMLIGLI